MTAISLELALRRLERIIAAEPDVKRVLHVAYWRGRFYYQIETPFATFPKAVIGTCNEDGDEVRVLLKNGNVAFAEELWRNQDFVLPPPADSRELTAESSPTPVPA